MIQQQTRFVGRVVEVTDGDTISVLREGKAVKVRLYGIDAPERWQAYGTKAQEYTAALTFRQLVVVMVRDTDRYGQLVGEVHLTDGRGLSQELVKEGLA